MKQLSRRHQKTIKSMSRNARLKLLAFPWPGNVRQLRNVIESMVVVDCDETLDVDDLPLELEPDSEIASGISPEGAEGSYGIASLVGHPLHEIEKIFIGETLKLAGGNREQTAEMLGIGERTLYRKIKEYKLH
jgi:two-component system response regulator HydG